MSLADFQKAGQLPADATWGTVTLAYTGRRADLVAVAMSYDKTLHHGLQTPFIEGTNRLFKGSMWHADATHNTLITTGNGGREPTRAQATLFYNGGQGQYRIEKLLQPGQQLWLDLGQITRNQIPDSDGKVLPPDLMTGSYELRDLDHPLVGELYEGKLVIDKTYGHASYGCAVCCGYTGAAFGFDPFSGPPGIDYAESVTSFDACSSKFVDVTGSVYNWASSNTKVTTLPNSTLHTVAVGTATGSGEVVLQSDEIKNNCPDIPRTPTQQENVKPQIDSIVPNTGQAGGVSEVAISGSGFGVGPTVNVTPSGIAVSGVSVSSDGTLINATFTIPSGATVGNYSVSVSVPSVDGGASQTSNSVTFAVTACASLTNFQRQSWVAKPATGELDITYAWSSSTGKQSDLAACQLAEYVTYPGTGATYTWPRPPFGQVSANPTSGSGSGANGIFVDQHLPPGSWVKPYTAASFQASQTYQYVCPCVNGGSQVQLAQYTITRSVTKNSDGTYKYTVTKSSGESATLNPLP